MRTCRLIEYSLILKKPGILAFVPGFVVVSHTAYSKPAWIVLRVAKISR
jgi:hypothetical protein